MKIFKVLYKNHDRRMDIDNFAKVVYLRKRPIELNDSLS